MTKLNDNCEQKPNDPVSMKIVGLKQQITLSNCIYIITGCVIGSGIFVSPVGILYNVKSVGMSCIIWTACGLYSVLCALCFSELGAALPRSGGEYMYIYTAFGDFVAFICLWIHVTINYCVGYAALSLIFSTYVLQPLFKDCDIPYVPLRILGALVYTLITAVNCRSVKWVTKLQAVITLSKLTALAAVIVIGIICLIKGETGRFENSFEGSDYGVGPIAMAFYSGVWAFSGWNGICMLAGEIINPQRNIPLAIIISVSIVTVIYLICNVAYFAVLAPVEMLKSSAVAVTFADQTMGPVAFLMPVLIAVSVMGTLNSSMLSFSRMLYVGAKMNHIPQFVAMLTIKHNTPAPSLMVICFIVLTMLNFDGVFYLIELSGFGASTLNAMVIAALLYLRWKGLHRPFKIHLSIPVFMFAANLVIVALTIYQKPRESGFAVFTILLGIPLYLLGPMWTHKPSYIQNKLDSMTRIIQKVCFVVKEENSCS